MPFRKWRTYTLPVILGWDFSGVVQAVGPGAAGLVVGDEVYARPVIDIISTFVVLSVPRVDSPMVAVRASILAGGKR